MAKAKVLNYINHVLFVVDGSGSMGHLSKDVVTVFDNQIRELAVLSKQVNQETRVSVYMFDDRVQNLIFDMDVLRLPSLADLYEIGGQTALIDATMKGIEDLQQTCQLYGDHAFLAFVLTDGGENASYKYGAPQLKAAIEKLSDSWTFVTFVPNQVNKFAAEKFGFPKENISIWSTDKAGLKDTGNIMREVATNYMKARSTGVRSMKNVFQIDVTKLSDAIVRKTLTKLKPSEYTLLPVGKDGPIKEFVESFLKVPYVQGSAYYNLMKPEKIQASKQVIVQSKKNGAVYSGQEARDLLGLPDTEVKVAPAQHADFNIFVQSTSLNRKLIGGTNVLIMK